MASSLDTLLAQMRKLQQGAPYDASLATAIQQAQRQSADLDRSYTMGRSDIDKGYGDLTRDLGLQRTTNETNTKGRYADTGLFHSGIHANAQGEVERDYQGGMSEAAQRRLSGYRGLDESRRGAESGIQDMLMGAQQDYSRRQAEAAQAQAEARAQAAAQAEQNRIAQQAAADQAAQLRAIAAASDSGGGYLGGASPMAAEALGGGKEQLKKEMGKWNYSLGIMEKMYGAQAALQWAYANARPGGAQYMGEGSKTAANLKRLANAAAIERRATKTASKRNLTGRQ